GGRRKAYNAANDWYSVHLPLYPAASRVQRMTTLRSNNRSGVTGVYRWPASGENCVDAYWAVQWVESKLHKPKRRKFSIKRFGERKAKAMAVDARSTALALMCAAELGK
ncbi:MAG TPA: AP2 domain-containing protein, partial [Burkholderiaceae bacterium]|nr:AP2 domain-containing protein [Burkholderiaceae bacterium]